MTKKKFTGLLATLGKVSMGIAAAGMLSSCAVADWFQGKTSDEEVKEVDKEVAKSVEKKATAYDRSLRDFGKMLDAYNITSVRVQSKLISNQTAERGLPDDVSRMLISAVNKIGRKVVYVPYDPSYVLNEANTGGDINRALPQIVLAGGITEFDKDLIEKGRELKTEVSIKKGDFGSNYDHDGGAGYEAKSGVSRITLDLQLMNYKTQTYLSGIQSINQVNIRKTKLGWGVGYFFQGSGLSFQYSLVKKQGKYYALRLLVELSVLEVMGKFFDVPYWRCIKGMSPDNNMIIRLRDEFDTLSDVDQMSYLKEYLFFHGETGFNRQSNTITSAELSQMDQMMQKYNCSSKADLFVKLWETVPIKESRARNKAYAKELARQARRSQNEQEQKIARYNALITHADSLYNSGRLTEAASAYRQASNIFPDQNDPKEMLKKIEQELAGKNTAPVVSTAPAVTTKPAVPAEPVVTTAPAPPTVTAPSAPPVPSAPAPEARAESKTTAKPVKKKEKPLNPFKKVEW